MSVANCPSCGAPVEFAIGSSAVVVCTDRGLELHDKVAPLRTGLAGVGTRTADVPSASAGHPARPDPPGETPGALRAGRPPYDMRARRPPPGGRA